MEEKKGEKGEGVKTTAFDSDTPDLDFLCISLVHGPSALPVCPSELENLIWATKLLSVSFTRNRDPGGSFGDDSTSHTRLCMELI